MRARPSRQRNALTVSVPAPLGGWNARDPIAAMSPTDAVIMDNVFPDTGLATVRGGTQVHTSVSGTPRSLMEWAGPSGAKLIVASTGHFYDVSTTGTSSVQASNTGTSQFQHTMFSNAAGSFLYVVNGEDTPRYYDGSNWTLATVTATTSLSNDGETLKHVLAHQQRLFFTQKDSLNLWYLPVNSINGTLTKFPLGSLARRGGHMVGIGSWTLDGGRGMEDQLVAVTSEGEVFLYEGTDPSSSSTWKLVGIYNIDRPIGERCLAKIGGDLIVITEAGFYPLSRALIADQTTPNVAISDKISGAVKSASSISREYFGWEACHYPRGRFLLFNVPTANLTEADQYVVNTVTGAWCRFKDQAAICWSTFQGNLFYAAPGAVMQADIGTDDQGQNIESDIQTAYNYFGQTGTQKLFKYVRPIFVAAGEINPALALSTDFKERDPTSTPTYGVADGPEWDDTDWDVSLWAGGDQVFARWQTVGGVGFNASLRIKFNTRDFGASLSAIDYLFEAGGVF